MVNILIVGVIALAIMISIIFNLQFTIKKVRISLFWIISLVGAIIVVASGLVNFAEVKDLLFNDMSMNPLKILILFISLTSISVLLDECGFFKYIAQVISAKAKTSQIKLFIYFYAIISFITIFTSNDIVILTFTPFICYFAKSAKIDPVPYIVSEFVAANTWSMFLLIGNPTNIFISTTLSVDFFVYSLTMFVPTLLAGITSFAILFLLFKKKLKAPLENSNVPEKLENKSLSIIGLIGLGLTIILVAISNYIKIEMWIITLSLSSLLLIINIIVLLIKKQKLEIVKNTICRLPYSLIPFLISFFILIVALEKSGVVLQFANALDNKFAIFTFGFLSLIMANMLNNIPMTILFTSIVSCLSIDWLFGGLYAVVIGSNIGAFLTPVGALAGIMFMNILRKNQVKFSFLDFIKYGVVIAIPTITMSLFGLYIIL